MSAGDDDVAYGIMVPPSRRESDGTHAEGLTNGSKTTPAHIQGYDDEEDVRSLKDQLKEKEKRIQALEEQLSDIECSYRSELETAKTELTETQSTVHFMQSMMDDNAKGLSHGMGNHSASNPPPTSLNPSSSLSSDQLKAIKNQNEDLKFRIQQLVGEMAELRTQLKVATAEARDSEARFRKFITERDDAMDGVDKERIWMSTQLSNSEHQLHQLQNENISLLLTIREQKDRQDQILAELEQAQKDRLPGAFVVQQEHPEDDPTPPRSRFGFKKKPKKIKDEQLMLAFSTAKAYFANKQQKQNEPYDLSQSLQREGSATSLTSSSLCSSVPSSKGQADLLARHMLEKKGPSYIRARPSLKSPDGLPLTLVHEIKLEKAERKRQKILHDMLDR